MICSDRVPDPALQELKMIKLLQINKYKVDFTEFAVAWVISSRVNHTKSAENLELCG